MEGHLSKQNDILENIFTKNQLNPLRESSPILGEMEQLEDELLKSKEIVEKLVDSSQKIIPFSTAKLEEPFEAKAICDFVSEEVRIEKKFLYFRTRVIIKYILCFQISIMKDEICTIHGNKNNQKWQLTNSNNQKGEVPQGFLSLLPPDKVKNNRNAQKPH